MELCISVDGVSIQDPKTKVRRSMVQLGCHGQGKTTVNFVVFFQVREKSRNFVFVKN